MIYFGEWMNVSVVRGGTLLLPYSSFLALMQEKKQKKIKASEMPAKFLSSRVGAYGIRPIRRHPTDGECANRANYHDSSFHKWNACEAYAIRPYMGTSKRGAYSYSQVGAYCIRPIRSHPTDGKCTNRINYHDSSFHKWNVCGAYAIRPYMGTPKCGTFSHS